MVISLKGSVSIVELTQVLSEVASFCGEDSQVTLTDVAIKLDIEHFVESPDEQKETVSHLLDALRRFQVQAKTNE